MTASTASSSLAATAAPVATSTAVADAPPPPTTAWTATPATLFVKLILNLLLSFTLFIYHYVDHANHAFLWTNWLRIPHLPPAVFSWVASCSALERDLSRVPKPNWNIWETDEKVSNPPFSENNLAGVIS